MTAIALSTRNARDPLARIMRGASEVSVNTTFAKLIRPGSTIGSFYIHVERRASNPLSLPALAQNLIIHNRYRVQCLPICAQAA